MICLIFSWVLSPAKADVFEYLLVKPLTPVAAAYLIALKRFRYLTFWVSPSYFFSFWGFCGPNGLFLGFLKDYSIMASVTISGLAVKKELIDGYYNFFGYPSAYIYTARINQRS
jgi:hypothetical protein